MKITYNSNNSGGGWWLGDDQWQALEQAGWTVQWLPERWLGALATEATGEFASKEEAIASFEAATGARADDQGCECCGEPHWFYEAWT